MTESLLFFLSLSILLAGIISLPLLPPVLRAKANFFFVLLTAAITSIPAVKVLSGATVDVIITTNSVFGNISFRIDSLSSWFILIINLTCINGAFYGIGYMKQYGQQGANLSLHWILFLLFQSSMLWVCMLQNGLAFLIAWEIMSISSLLLVMFEYSKADTIKAGVNYLVQMHIGVAMLSIGFIWVHLNEGSFDFSAIGVFFSRHTPFCPFFIFFIGFGIKAGFVPLHTWLPHAHPAAPSHVSGVMSGVIVKLGIYGILRMITYLHSGLLQIGESILFLSLFTAFYGILNAAVHRDFKRMLAFCTIENIGIIGMGIGIGLIGKATGNSSMFFIGFAAALLHTLNHSLYKSLLFFTAGNIYQQTHTRDMEQLGGLNKSMPVTGFLFLCGALAIGAMPPFNGFVSEFLIYTGLIEGIQSSNIQFNLLMILSIATLTITGGISMLTFTKSYGTIFLGSTRKPLAHTPKEVSIIMRVPLFIILTLMLLIGIFPNVILTIVAPVIKVFDSTYTSTTPMNIASPALVMTSRVSLLFIALVALIFFVRANISG
ncbi:MAG TPA: proton-conducting transporter membrane subunit, partial [Chitinophagaceae bacterium]|nr:proton-conducting transporter membrane subunit [Chitinophagaceae bacterium]